MSNYSRFTAVLFHRQATGAKLCALILLTAVLSACGGAGQNDATLVQTDCPAAQQLESAVDCVMSRFLESTGVTAATVTVVRHGAPILDKGYGYKDAARTIPLQANALLVTASIVKPVTSAAIQKLAATGVLRLSDHAFCTGSNAPCWLPAELLSPGSDPRACTITISHLLRMTAGFDSGGSGDPILQEAAIQQQFNLATPPQRRDVIRYRMAKPLDSAPGQTYKYSNFGYLVLGQIIEQASETSYVDFANSTIFAPMGVARADFAGAASRLRDHDLREPNYICTKTGPSVYERGATVQLNDGTISTNNWVSGGFAVTTSRAMAMLGANYRIWDSNSNLEGMPLNGSTADQWWHGEWCGTQSIVAQRASGVSYAVLMNKNSPDYSDQYARVLQGMLNTLLQQLDM